jgi:hypothetical protein
MTVENLLPFCIYFLSVCARSAQQIQAFVFEAARYLLLSARGSLLNAIRKTQFKNWFLLVTRAHSATHYAGK